LRRQKSQVATVSFGEFQHGEGLPIDDFRGRKNLP
jgi:hypothetical protein